MDFLPISALWKCESGVCLRVCAGGGGLERGVRREKRIQCASRTVAQAATHSPKIFSSGASRAAASPRRSRPSPRRRRDAAVRAEPAAGQRMLTPHGAAPARCLSEGERAAARLHRGHTFFNVSQGKFGLSCPVTSALARVAAPKAAF